MTGGFESRRSQGQAGRAMKILFVTNMFPNDRDPVGGIFVKEQIDDVARLGGFEPSVYVIDGVGEGPAAYLRSIHEIPHLIRNCGADVVHVHYGLSGLFLAFHRPAARVFLTLHGSDIMPRGGKPVQVLITRRILGKADRVFVLSESMRREVERHTERYEMLPCGVDVDFFAPPPGAGFAVGERLVVFPNSPRRAVKNYPLFEAAVAQASSQGGVRVRTACIEGLDREGVRDLLARADCLLMTSRSEGSPQVVKEALACGTPVVSVPVGDVPVLLDGIPGCRVATGPDDAAELGTLLVSTLLAEKDRGEIRRAFVEKGRYSNHAVAQRLVALYAQSSP